ncbi:three-Cys-motif partner protein TcmP [Desulfosporosinus sp. Sb-LF]|uniref:three-Cys-motif partner protein TcmP n=1 Tax=Desulfosporosinus sp. Sb-LF TaxID=2560027 RepID=UPI0013052E73|nr:three-Cys-motif partner protein TcmP [Desulfosporosinus sp. Sb-LF]
MTKNNEDFFDEKKPWSVIKDELLGCYLKPYFSKILATQRPVFYVDAFAGKGIFLDGNPGSPLIALEIISKVLSITNFRKPIIKSCLIELNHASDLQENVNKYKDVTVIVGKYEENIEQQLQGKQSQNVFLYIDPYGVKSLHFSIFKKLPVKSLHSIEMLINFNSFGFIREACSAMNVKFDIGDLEDIVEIDNVINSSNKPIDDLSEVAGGDYWKEIIEGYKKGIYDGYEAEKRFSDKYCEKLREQFNYVLNMPIRLKMGQRPKYRMIHATNHAQGCVLMNDNMYKRWEALQNLQNQGQISMLLLEDVENQSINKTEMQKEILELMKSHREYVDLNTFHAEFVSKYGVRFSTSDICTELEKLYNANKLEVKRHPELTSKGKPSKFWTTSKDKTVKLRCNNEKS